MKKLRRVMTMSIAICMILGMNLTAFAEEAATSSPTLDYDQKGSITVDVLSTDTGKAISGGVLTLYKVADAKQVDGNNVFELTDTFKESQVNLAGINEASAGAEDLSLELENYVNSNKITGNSAAVDQNGQAIWNQLDLGIYLVINTTSAKGYEAMNSFLITVPRYLKGTYVYDVSANPKSESLESAATTGTTSTSSTSTTSTDAPKTTTKTTTTSLPKTGQLWWPVPILVFAGLLFVIFGCYRRRQFGESNNAFR